MTPARRVIRRACLADHGREAVYDAEEAAFGGTELDVARPLADLQERAARVVVGEWWRQAGAPPVEVVAARASAGSSSARDAVGPALIRLAAGQLDEATLAHELAHVLAGIGHGHDERFRAAHVDVTAMLAGSGAASMLVQAYGAFGLPVGRRRWPPPVRGSGDTFVMVP